MSKITDSEAETILSRLKRETAELHRETENLMPISKVNFSLPDYKRLLANFYALYAYFEPELECAVRRHSIDFDYEARLKTPKLKTDLQNLKISIPAFSETVSANEARLFDSKEKTFGALYVVEGATLGGQVISRILKQKFDLSETSGAAFFSGYGSNTGAMWNSFRTAITEFAATSHNHEEIIAAAAQTFQLFGRATGNF